MSRDFVILPKFCCIKDCLDCDGFYHNADICALSLIKECKKVTCKLYHPEHLVVKNRDGSYHTCLQKFVDQTGKTFFCNLTKFYEMRNNKHYPLKNLCLEQKCVNYQCDCYHNPAICYESLIDKCDVKCDKVHAKKMMCEGAVVRNKFIGPDGKFYFKAHIYLQINYGVPRRVVVHQEDDDDSGLTQWLRDRHE